MIFLNKNNKKFAQVEMEKICDISSEQARVEEAM